MFFEIIFHFYKLSVSWQDYIFLPFLSIAQDCAVGQLTNKLASAFIIVPKKREFKKNVLLPYNSAVHMHVIVQQCYALTSGTY